MYRLTVLFNLSPIRNWFPKRFDTSLSFKYVFMHHMITFMPISENNVSAVWKTIIVMR